MAQLTHGSTQRGIASLLMVIFLLFLLSSFLLVLAEIISSGQQQVQQYKQQQQAMSAANFALHEAITVLHRDEDSRSSAWQTMPNNNGRKRWQISSITGHINSTLKIEAWGEKSQTQRYSSIIMARSASLKQLPNVALTAPTTPNFFEQIFGLSWALYKQRDFVLQVDASDMNQLQQLGKVIIYSGNFQSHTDLTLGSLEQPIILIIDGDLQLYSSLNITGILWLRGVRSAGGNINVTGAAVFNKNPPAGAIINSTYNHQVLEKLKNLGGFVQVPGTGRDW